MTLTWEEVRARSASPDGSLCCYDCYASFHHGLGFPCPKHATEEEKAEANKRIAEAPLREHPLLLTLTKEPDERQRENERPLTRFDFKVPKR